MIFLREQNYTIMKFLFCNFDSSNKQKIYIINLNFHKNLKFRGFYDPFGSSIKKIFITIKNIFY